MPQGTIYLIHFSRPYKHARHYLGYTTNLEERLECHRSGDGHSARLMQVITEAGIPWELVRTWQGSRKDERRLKRQKNSPRLCPICRRERGIMKAAKIVKARVGRHTHYLELRGGAKGKGRRLARVRYDANSPIAFWRAVDSLTQDAQELGYTVDEEQLPLSPT